MLKGIVFVLIFILTLTVTLIGNAGEECTRANKKALETLVIRANDAGDKPTKEIADYLSARPDAKAPLTDKEMTQLSILKLAMDKALARPAKEIQAFLTKHPECNNDTVKNFLKANER